MVWCDVLVLNLHRYYVFKGCLDINLLPSDYISYRLNVRFNIICKSKLEHKVFILFFFLPDRPTHHHERWDNGKRNILLAWPKQHIAQGALDFRAWKSLSVGTATCARTCTNVMVKIFRDANLWRSKTWRLWPVSLVVQQTPPYKTYKTLYSSKISMVFSVSPWKRSKMILFLPFPVDFLFHCQQCRWLICSVVLLSSLSTYVFQLSSFLLSLKSPQLHFLNPASLHWFFTQNPHNFLR